MVDAEHPAPVATLLDNQRAFLRYLERRVGDRALAEDILQEAFAKVVARPEQAPADDAVIPWFYRTLRNAANDQLRHRAETRVHDPRRIISRVGGRGARVPRFRPDRIDQPG